MTNTPATEPTTGRSKAKLGTLRALWPFVRQHMDLFMAWLAALAVASATVPLR